MTLFIVILSTVNIALGYALAVYLGHGQLPWQVGSFQLSRKVPMAPAIDEHVDDLETSIQEEETKPEEVVETDQPIEASEAEAAGDEDSSDVETAEESPAIESVEPAQQTDDAEIASAIDEVTPSVETQTNVAEDEPSQPPATAEESDEAKPAELQVDADGEPDREIDEKFLEGIEAFQSQLQEQEEELLAGDSPESTADNSAEPEQQEASAPEPVSEKQEESPEPEDVLEGIEAFRTQLASMQQEPASPSEEVAEEEAEEIAG